MFKKLRIAILLFIFVTVALSAYRAKVRTTSWKTTLHIAVFPLDADHSPTTQRYLQNLGADSYEGITEYLNARAADYKLSISRPVNVYLGAILPDNTPPAPQAPRNANPLQAIWWSLNMRYWAWRYTPPAQIQPDIRLFVAYHDPEISPRVPHSVGIQKGQIGFIHAYASRNMNGSNAVIITHELLHALGATDKYNLTDDQPIFPEGYAEPDRQPRYPQTLAEIMGGRIPISDHQAEIPRGLGLTVIGEKTAQEIGWKKITN